MHQPQAWPERGRPPKSPKGFTLVEITGVLLIAAAKLALHPFLVGVAVIFVFPLTQLEVHTLVLAAALPVGSTVFLFAERQGANAERIAAAILVSTALAFVTFSTLCWALGVQLPS